MWRLSADKLVSFLVSGEVSCKSDKRRVAKRCSRPRWEEEVHPNVPIGHVSTRGFVPTVEERFGRSYLCEDYWRNIRLLVKGDEHSGRGSKQRELGRNILCNHFKVSTHGRSLAVAKCLESFQFHSKLRKHLARISGTRLVCYYLPTQAYRADALYRNTSVCFFEQTTGSVTEESCRHRPFGSVAP